MRRVFLFGAAAASLALPSAASAAPARYVLGHPDREHCKRHYSRVAKHAKGKRQVWCVRHKATPPAPTPPSTPPPPGLIATTTTVTTTFSTGYGPPYLTVTGTLDYFVGVRAQELRGEPITYTIIDTTTTPAKTVGSFGGASNGYALCSIAFHLNEQQTAAVYVGEATHGYPACALAPISLPLGHSAVITGAYAGNSSYAPSVSDRSASFQP